jgi:hypothetical protein
MKEKDKNPKTNKPLSNPNTQQLFKGLLVSVAGLVAVLMILLAAVMFFAFYDGSVEPGTAVASDSSIESKLNNEPFNGEVVDGKDVATGLVVGDGFELVRTTCTGCHSSAIIVQNRFTREGWKAKIVWMQETQGLWDLGENEPAILDYLATHYSPEPPKGRRVPLKDIQWYELKN